RMDTSGNARTSCRYSASVAGSRMVGMVCSSSLSSPRLTTLGFPSALVVLGVREQLLDVDNAGVVADVHNQPVVVALDVEHRLVAHEVGVAEGLAHLTQVVPYGLTGDVVPVGHLLDTVAVDGRLGHQAALRDDAHPRVLPAVHPSFAFCEASVNV